MIELDSGVFMEHVEDLVNRKRWPELREVLRLLEPADIALILDELPLDRLPLLYRLLPKELAAEVFVEMDPPFIGNRKSPALRCIQGFFMGGKWQRLSKHMIKCGEAENCKLSLYDAFSQLGGGALL